MQCPNCQKEIPDVANVCGFCGHRLKASAESVLRPPPPAPVPPAKIPTPRTGMPSWAWGLIAGLLIAVFIGGFLFMNNGNGSNRPAPEQILESTSPPVKPTPTLTPMPTRTSTNTPQPSSSLPIGLLNNLETIETDDFSRQTDLWGVSESGIQWEGGFAQVTGIPTFETFLNRGSILKKGQGALFLFEYSTSDMNINFLLEHGEWNTSGYKRLGINLQAVAVADIYDGTESFWGEPLQGNIRFTTGRMYYVLLALDASQGFSAIVGEADAPMSYNIFRQDPAPDWPSDEWNIAVQANAGQTRIDQYYLLSFE